ncbi:hypothetical protein, partial [Bacillus subtilis]|uniref:hypothetical protein n=1 Tax=Bacillus subtilis TaxID=1423 RepID=UPI002029C406
MIDDLRVNVVVRREKVEGGCLRSRGKFRGKRRVCFKRRRIFGSFGNDLGQWFVQFKGCYLGD